LQFLESARKALHDWLLVAADRPAFRRTNAISFGGNVRNGGYLLNVHNGLANSGGQSIVSHTEPLFVLMNIFYTSQKLANKLRFDY